MGGFQGAAPRRTHPTWMPDDLPRSVRLAATEHVLHLAEKILRAEWFWEECLALVVARLRVAAGINDLHLGRDPAGMVDQFLSGHAGHHEVGEGQFDPRLGTLEPFEAFWPLLAVKTR